MKNLKTLKDRVVVITGGGRGIGLATATALAKAGAKVAIGDIDTPLAEQAATTLGGFGGYLDVRSAESFKKFIVATELVLGPIDVLINNAGIMPMGAFTDESDAISDAQIDINFRGVIHGMKAVLPSMRARNQGHIVNVASLAGKFPIPGASVYCGTKFAVVGMTAAVREELRDTAIRFSTVMPSKVLTELASGTGNAPIPTIKPEDVSDAILAAITENLTEVTVPRYLATVPSLYGLVPSWLNTRIRRLMGDHHILNNLDRKSRGSYEQRVQQLADTHTKASTSKAEHSA